MQRIWNFKSKLNGLVVSATTLTPSSSSMATLSKQPLGKVDMALFPEEKKGVLTNTASPKHSNAFKSVRATGMNKLGQMQFVEKLRSGILDHTPLLDRDFDKHTSFKVVFGRNSSKTTSGTSHPFSEGTLYAAKLIARAAGTTEWVLVERSAEKEFLADAVEELCEKVMSRVGKATEGM